MVNKCCKEFADKLKEKKIYGFGYDENLEIINIFHRWIDKLLKEAEKDG